jgi:hypothetical protein
MKQSGVTLEGMQFSEQDLRTVLGRALRSALIAIVIGIPMIWWAWGWRSMLLFVVGGAIAATGIVEWRQLMSAVLARFNPVPDSPIGQADSEPAPPQRPIRGVVFWFVVRLIAAAALLYVSLRSLDGKVAALLLGLALAVFALLIEAVRLLRDWSA